MLIVPFAMRGGKSVKPGTFSLHFFYIFFYIFYLDLNLVIKIYLLMYCIEDKETGGKNMKGGAGP